MKIPPSELLFNCSQCGDFHTGDVVSQKLIHFYNSEGDMLELSPEGVTLEGEKELDEMTMICESCYYE
jgi:hypothetical protein